MLFGIIVIVLAVVTYFAWKSVQPSPILKIKDTAKTVVNTAKDIVDVNNDGKVNLADAVATVNTVKKTGKKVVKKTVKKISGAKKKTK
jgi:hypothetical protein